MATQKCKNILLQATLNDFWSSGNTNQKKLSFQTLTLSGSYCKKCKNRGSYFCFKWFKILLNSEFSKNSLTFKVCKPTKSMKVRSEIFAIIPCIYVYTETK